MSWAQRLEAIRAAKGPSGELTKPPKPPFVSFGSEQDGRFHSESAANTPDHSDLRAKLRHLAEAENLPPAIVDGLPDGDLDPDNGAHLLDDAALRRWLHVRTDNERMRQGIAPPGWTQASHCERCGPVRLWTGAPLHVIGCPWCHVRRAGGIVPRPAVTCATCAHQQPRPGTSYAGMHACAKGRPLHFALELHVCTEWKPQP